jgi:hypothetical protein
MQRISFAIIFTLLVSAILPVAVYATDAGSINTNTTTGTQTTVGVGAASPVSFPTTPKSNTGSVLGIESCTVSQKITGNIYLNKNNNSNRDSDEDGISNVEIKIYYFDETNTRRELKTVRTDSAGKYQVDACAASYEVELNPSTLPANTKIDSKQVLSVRVFTGTDANNVNFEVSQPSSVNLLPIFLILLVILGLIVGVFVLSRSRNDNK